MGLVVLVVAAAVVWWQWDRSVAGQPSAARTPTFWERIETGDVGRTEALQAFAQVFGGLPGVDKPAGSPEPKGFGVSGSGPTRWVLNHWSELTPAQRQAVGKVLATDDAPRLRQDDKDRAAAELRPMIDSIVTDLGARLGRTMPPPLLSLTDVERTFDNGSPVFAWSVVLAKGESIDKDYDFEVRNDAPADHCTLYLPPSLWHNAITDSRKSTIAHEITHCYQGFGYPTLGAFRSAGRWIIEGGAEFGGIDYSGKAAGSPNNWQLYLTTQAPLFDRTYTAMGWWFHLQHVGHDPWKAFPTIWAGAQDDVTAYVTAGGDRDDVYDTWAPSFLREPGYGDAWEVHGVDVSDEQPPRGEIPGRGSTVAPAFDARVVEVHVGRQEAVLLVTANQPVRVHDQASFEDVHITEGDYCLGDTCVCPEDSERAGEEIQQVQAPVWLGIPGGETGTAVNTDVIPLDDYCRKNRPKTPKPPAPGKAPAGTTPHAPPANPHSGAPRASSVGEPHLTSFDGHQFGFQAGGEFTLAESDKDSLEIQARQEPVHYADGKENLSVSINTALAANVAGDRVSVTAAAGRPQLRVNGEVAEPRAPQRLPKGGAVNPEGGGYAVRWPDGTTVWATPIGAKALNLVVRPASSRKDTLHGMLGPFEGVPDNPAMTDRSGRRYDTVTTDQLYKEIAESWRVGDTSLFDYAPGQSTETFTRHDMPGPAPQPTDEQKAAASAACAGVPNQTLRENCEYDVAVTQDTEFASGYEALLALVDAGGGSVRLDKRLGPEEIKPGQKKTYTVTGGTDLYFGTDTDCAAATTIFWRVTAPDGTETLLAGMCENIGRRHSAKPGTWRVEVTVDAGAGEGGKFAFHVREAGASRAFDVTLPATVDSNRPSGAGTLTGPGAEDRFRFKGLSGDKVTIKSTTKCTNDDALYWGLESPDGFVISLRARACEDLGEQTLTADGTWTIVISNQTDDKKPHSYSFVAR